MHRFAGMNGGHLLALFMIGLFAYVIYIALFERKPKPLPNEGPRAFFVVEEFEPGKYVLAWDRGFHSVNAARRKAYAMKREPHFASLTLKIGHWDGKAWGAFYETI